MDIQEYERIVEFSFIPKPGRFVVRFLDGSSYILLVEDLPKKLQSKKPDWENAQLAEDRSALVVQATNDRREIPAFMIHSKGTKAT